MTFVISAVLIINRNAEIMWPEILLLNRVHEVLSPVSPI